MKCIPVGKVVAGHGLRGEVKFKYYNEAPEGFFRYSSLLVRQDDGLTELRPTEVTFRKGFFYIEFEGLDSPEKASFLVDRELSVREEDLPPLDDGEYYDYQLIGLGVVNQRDEKIGKVEHVLHTGASDIMVVRGTTEMFVPMVEGYISKIDLEALTITIDEEALLV